MTIGRKLTYNFVRLLFGILRRSTALHHKALNDPVEGQTVIEALASQLDKILDSDRCGRLVQLHSNGAVIFNHNIRVIGRIGIKGFHSLFLLTAKEAQSRQHSQRDCQNLFHNFSSSY